MQSFLYHDEVYNVGDKMVNNTSLREIEKKTYMSYHQDGLFDIFVGTYVLLFGIGIYL
jgi:hypothetical protein